MNYGSQSMVGRMKQVLIKRPEAAFLSQDHLNEESSKYGFMGVPNYETVLSEYAVFENALREEGVVTHYLPFSAHVGLDSIYTHDALKITEKGAIYFPMGKAVRQREGEATRTFLESIGIPTLGVIESPAMIEGGDVLWIDKRTVAIGRGYRTNDAGIEAFKQLTEGLVDTYIVVPMPHGDGPEACLHLMSIISLISDDLAVVYSKYMPIFFRQWLVARGIELIETSDVAYDKLGSNVLAIAPGIAVMVAGNSQVQTQLEARGVKVYTYPGEELSYRGTGGPTCLTCPLERV